MVLHVFCEVAKICGNFRVDVAPGVACGIFPALCRAGFVKIFCGLEVLARVVKSVVILGLVWLGVGTSGLWSGLCAAGFVNFWLIFGVDVSWDTCGLQAFVRLGDLGVFGLILGLM